MTFPIYSSGNQNSSVLDRQNEALGTSAVLKPMQSQMDTLVSNFIEQASDWRSLAALTAGGLAYRWGRIGVMGLRVGASANVLWWTPLRAASVAVGLGSEVTAYEVTHRTLHTFAGSHAGQPLQKSSRDTSHASRLWSFSGPEGWREGWISSFITFGTLKGFGKLAEGQNLLFQHGVQDLAMVTGHQLVYRVGGGPKPEGTFAEQMLHAEAVNLQLSAGMSLGHALTSGKMLAAERSLDLKLKIINAEARNRVRVSLNHMAMESLGPDSQLNPTDFWMSGDQKMNGGTPPPKPPSMKTPSGVLLPGEGKRQPDRNPEFFLQNIESLASPKSPLQEKWRSQYQRILDSVLSGDLSKEEAYPRLLKTLEEDYVEKLSPLGVRSSPLSLRAFLKELFPVESNGPDWVKALRHDLPSQWRVTEMNFKEAPGHDHPAFQELNLLFSIFRLLEKELGLPLTSLYQRNEKEVRLRLLPPPFIFSLFEKIYRKAAFRVKIASNMATLAEIAQGFQLGERDFLLSPESRSVHDVDHLHPYVVAMHDFYHIAKIQRLTPQERSDRIQLFNILNSLRYTSPDHEAVEIFLGLVLDGDYSGDLDHRALFRVFAGHFPSREFTHRFHHKVKEAFGGHPQRDEIIKALREEFRFKNPETDESTSSFPLPKMLGLSVGLAEFLKPSTAQAASDLSTLTPPESVGLLGLGLLTAVGVGYWLYRRARRPRKWFETPPYSELKLPLTDEERKILEPIYGMAKVPRVLTGREWAKIEARVFERSFEKVGSFYKKAKQDENWSLWVKVEHHLELIRRKQNLPSPLDNETEEDPPVWNWARPHDPNPEDILPGLSPAQKELSRKLISLNERREEKERGIPEAYQNYLKAFTPLAVGDHLRTLFLSPSPQTRETAARVYEYHARQLTKKFHPDKVPENVLNEILVGAKALKDLRKDPVLNVRSTAAVAYRRVRVYLPPIYLLLLDHSDESGLKN